MIFYRNLFAKNIAFIKMLKKYEMFKENGNGDKHYGVIGVLLELMSREIR